MKRKVIAGFVSVTAVALAVLITSCGNKENSYKGDSVSFETFSYRSYAVDRDVDSMRMENPEFKGLWNVTAEGVLPVYAGKHDISLLRDTVMALASVKDIDGKITVRLPGYLDAPAEKQDTTNSASILMNKISVSLLNSEVLVMQVFNYSYPEGAAHGLYANTYVNYDLKRGKIIGLSDLFTPGFEKYVLPRIISRLQADGNLSEDQEKVKIPENFRITEEGIEFVFGIYAVAPNSSGEPRVGFYTSDLEDILTPAGKAILAE